MKFFGKIYFVFQLIAFVIELWYLYTWLGIIGVILGFVICPVVWVLLPFVMLFRSGMWLPLVITLIPLLMAGFAYINAYIKSKKDEIN